MGLWVEVVTDGDIHHTPSVYEWIMYVHQRSWEELNWLLKWLCIALFGKCSSHAVFFFISQLVSLSITTHTREEKVIFDPTLSTTKAVSFTFNYGKLLCMDNWVLRKSPCVAFAII